MSNQYKNLSREVYIICLSKFIVTLGAFIWPLFTIILSQKLGFSEGKITLYISVGVFINIFAGILGGMISDRFGRKRTIAVFEFFAMLSFLSIIYFPIGVRTAHLLLLGMMFFGFAWPAHDALLANVTKTSERESAYSLSYLANNLGIIFGPAIGGFLLKNHFNIFIILDVLTTAIGWFLIMKYVKEPKVSEVEENKLEEKREGSIISIIMERPIIFFYGILLLFTSVIYGQLDFTLPLYIKSLFDDPERIFGFIYSFNGLVVVIFTPLLTILLSKKTAMQKVNIGLILYVIATFGYAVTGNLIGLFTLILIFTLGEIVLSIGVAPIMSKIVPGNMMARASSIIGVFYTLGHLISINVAGTMLEYDYRFQNVWITLGVLSVIGYCYYLIFNYKFKDTLNYVDKFDRNRN